MVLKIKLGKKRERRLKKHLEKEHPSVRRKTFLENNDFSTRKQIDRILDSSPNIKCQLLNSTQL